MTFRTLVRSASAPLVVALLAVGCGTSPSGISVQFLVVPSVGGSYSMTLEGRTYQGASLQTVELSEGVYEVSGTAAGTANFGTRFLVGFTGSAAGNAGGVKTGSITSLSGPSATASGCGIGFFVPNAGPFQFRFRFTVTSDPAAAC